MSPSRALVPILVVWVMVLGGACSQVVPPPYGQPSGNDGGAPLTPEGGPDGGGDAALPPLEPQPPATIAPAQRLDASSSPVVFDALRGGVWTANGDVGSISYVDVVARAVVREIPIGKDVRSVALSPDAKWIAAVDREGASVTLVDANDGVVARAIPLGTHPRACVWDSADPRWLYVAVEDDGTVAVVDRTLGVLDSTIPVGRLPSGVAVARQRNELYVTHRVDRQVSIVDLSSRAVAATVLVSLQAQNPDPTVPQGTPFGFESLAWAPDGDVAWLPHELLAGTHPFQFKETLFPTISVVDLSKRAEVETDPNDPNGAIAGRKNLFDAIDILDDTGTPSVLSQPCAAVFHPAGKVAWALACASEDLIVFDAFTGIAVDLLRNLPGDHPVGLALDDLGQRGFVVFDQSHTLATFDTAGGNPTLHSTFFGDPIPLVAQDPVAAPLRAGLTLFYRANSSKGTYSTTGNNWMSCGGCHLDGLVSTNAFFFETLRPADPAADAQIGHVGLKDLFSTAPTPSDPSFSPHDILVAFRDQGGLDADRQGDEPGTAVDPSNPPSGAAQMAQELANVVARDLPIGPSWLLDRSAPLDPTKDGAWCGGCHQPEYQAWQKSVHSLSATDPMMLFCAGVETGLKGPQFSRHCAGCHDPVSARLGDTSLTSKRGITCLGCHDVVRTIRAGGNADLEATSHDWTQDHKAWATASLTLLTDPKFCGGCHQQFVPGTGLKPSFSTLDEWEGSGYAGNSGAKETRCVECHMPKTAAGPYDHRFVGGNLYMGMLSGAQDLVADQTKNLQTFATVTAAWNGTNVAVQVRNRGSGHDFPTGVSDIREAWVEVQALDAQKNVLARIGGPGQDGLLPAGAARLGTDVASSTGTVLLKHELSVATAIPFDQRVAPESILELTIQMSGALPAGAVEFDAVLFYRNLRTTYYRTALANPSALPPETELARAKID